MKLRLQQAVVPTFRRTGDEQVDAALRELSPFMQRIAELAVPHAELTGIALINGTNRVRHNLGRVIKRWQIIDRNNNALVYRTAASPASDADPKQEIWLVSNGSITVSLDLW